MNEIKEKCLKENFSSKKDEICFDLSLTRNIFLFKYFDEEKCSNSTNSINYISNKS